MIAGDGLPPSPAFLPKEKETRAVYSVTNTSQRTRIVHDSHGRAVEIGPGATVPVDLHDVVADRYRARGGDLKVHEGEVRLAQRFEDVDHAGEGSGDAGGASGGSAAMSANDLGLTKVSPAIELANAIADGKMGYRDGREAAKRFLGDDVPRAKEQVIQALRAYKPPAEPPR